MVEGISGGRVAQLVQKYEKLTKDVSDETPKGSGMSTGSRNRLSELMQLPASKLDNALKNELAGLQRSYDNPGLLKLAQTVQQKGGVLGEHAVALTKIADDRDICICIRGVNPLATGLVESGFGTKDMSIKAKSSNLPPLNGLIPVDQRYGKKGNDPSDVAKFNDKNHHAIEDKVATSVDAKMPRERLDMLAKETGSLRIEKHAPGLAGNELLLTGNDFKTTDKPKGQDFHFIAVEKGGEVTIYAAKQGKDGNWSKSDAPIQVMGNRDGKPVTADYDLALVAPRIKDLGSEHMSTLKMTSFSEVSRRTAIVERFMKPVETALNEYREAAASGDTGRIDIAREKLGKLTGGLSDKEDSAIREGAPSREFVADLSRRAAEKQFLTQTVPQALAQNQERYEATPENVDIARGEILDWMAPTTGSPLSGSEFREAFFARTGVDLRADTRYETIIENYPNLNAGELDLLSRVLGASIEGTATRDLGIVSRFVRDLIPELNQTVGQTGGREVFHHGDDSGNPYSVEKDNFPMTVILPKGATRGGEPIRVVENADQFLELAKDLKRQGYAVPVNEMWNSRTELMSVRTESFTEARNQLAQHLGATVQDMIKLAHLSRPV